MMKFLTKIMVYLKDKWGVQSTWHFVLINIVFACTGFSVLYVKDYIYALMGLSDASFTIKFILFFILVLPLYNVLLLVWGTLFGQFRFFWNYEKLFFTRMAKLFTTKRTLKER